MEVRPLPLYGINKKGNVFTEDKMATRQDIIAVTTDRDVLGKKIQLVDPCGDKPNLDEFARPVFDACQDGEEISFVIAGVRVIRDVTLDVCECLGDPHIPRRVAAILARSGADDHDIIVSYYIESHFRQCWFDPHYAIELDDVRDLIVEEK